MSTEPGLRERKKQQTRERISSCARDLFAAHGFDAVKVSDIARAADVSEGTVFNYFPTKEDIFYGGMEAFESELVDAVRERRAGTSVATAFADFVIERTPRLARKDVGDVIARAARVIASSPALQAREREVVARYTDALAALIVDELGAGASDVEPWAVANALMGVQRALVTYVRTEAQAGRRGQRLAREAAAQAQRGFARLEHGVDAYAVKERR